LPFKDRFHDPLLALSFALLGLVGALLAFEELVGALPGELGLVRSFHTQWRPGYDRDVLTFFGTLGTPLIAAVSILVLAALVAHRRGPRAGAFILAASVEILLVGVLKSVIGVTPAWHQFTRSDVGNFPSGHVAYAAAVWGAAAWMMWPRARDVSAILWTMVACMGPARVFIGAHLLSDVIAGYALGFAWLIWMHRLVIERRSLRTPWRRRWLPRPALRAAARRVRRRSAAGTRDRSAR
jgi:membrane-associated phospholipid phosphatase